MTVHPDFIESYSSDELLLQTLPTDVKIHYVKAWKVELTKRFGLGSLSIRSFFHFRKKGDLILKDKRFDLIYFSTTAFHVMALGPYWKKKFGIPFILDMQDPWRNDFYLDKPKKERPPKFFISYNIDKLLEGITIPKADGVISVSEGYCKIFAERYGYLRSKCVVIPFGAMPEDYTVMRRHFKQQHNKVHLPGDKLNIVYIGRGGHDMQFSVTAFLKALQRGISLNAALFKNVHCWFIGTSYAKAGTGYKTIQPLAEAAGVGEKVTEITDRLSYFATLSTLSQADILFIPGSTDKSYTASKIYPYVLAKKPMLSIFHQESSVVEFMNRTSAGVCVTFTENDTIDGIINDVYKSLEKIIKTQAPPQTNWEAFRSYTAEHQAQKQVDFFDKILRGK